MYRQGAVGALLDIYEQAINGLKNMIGDIPEDALTIISDPTTTDENCRSIQSILSHIVHSGHGYATRIQNLKRIPIIRPDKAFHETVKEYTEELDNLFMCTRIAFKDMKDAELEQLDNSLKIKTEWGQLYDTEQMMEHAIVHILRHTRQIEKIKQNQLK